MYKPTFDTIFMNLATDLAKRSHCVKAQVGAVLVKDTRIISIGYNGPPAGTHNCDEEFPEQGCPRDSKGSCFAGAACRRKCHFVRREKRGKFRRGNVIYYAFALPSLCKADFFGRNKAGLF